MGLVNTPNEIRKNLETMHRYLFGTKMPEREWAQKKLGNGKNFVAGTLNGRAVFGPSRFTGAEANTRKKHEADPGNGGITDDKIDAILGDRIRQGHPDWEGLENSYVAYCDSVDVRPSNYSKGNERTFWKLDHDFDWNVAHDLDLDATTFVEGRRIPGSVMRLERSSKARKACIKHHGTTCVVCEFDFKERYGKLGSGFIHVHHLNPLKRGVAKVDPKKDLRPVCPNCHCMLHRGKRLLSPAELRKIYYNRMRRDERRRN